MIKQKSSSPLIIKITPDQIQGAKGVGGKTGSVRVAKDEITYQYKPPIAENSSWIRRNKANNLDGENFGEVLAARIAKAFDPDTLQPRVPDVSFVVRGKYVAIASKYLTGQLVQSLDDYYYDPQNLRTKSHVKLIRGKKDYPNKGFYGIEKNLPLKEELAGAIALSALVGDHDVNPGNMIVIENKDNPIRIGRIDYGHAFNDLMHFSNLGGQKIHNNNIIDFFNRGTVDGVPKAQSKLWRDYPGLVPSKEMANALKNLATQDAGEEKIASAINEVKMAVKDILNEPHVDKKHVIKSFERISEHVSGKKFDNLLPNKLSDFKEMNDKQIVAILDVVKANTSEKVFDVLKNYVSNAKSGSSNELKKLQSGYSKLQNEVRVDAIFKGIEDYSTKNLRQMAYAGNVMALQVDIKAAVKERDKEKLADLKEQYNTLQNNRDGPFSWIKETPNNPPFKGNFDEFVAHQKNIVTLNICKTAIINFMKSEPKPPEHEIAIARDLLAVTSNPKKSPKDRVALLQNKIQATANDPKPKSNLFSRLVDYIFSNPENKKVIENHPKETATSFKNFKTNFQEIVNDRKTAAKQGAATKGESKEDAPTAPTYRN